MIYPRNILLGLFLWSLGAVLGTFATFGQEPQGSQFPDRIPWPAWAKPPASGVESLSTEQAQRWLRWVIPLPKRVRLEGKLLLPASELSFRLGGVRSDVAEAAVDRLLRSRGYRGQP